MTTNTDPDVTSNQSADTTSQGDLLASLVGEGKKFRSVEDLARGKVEADSFVEKLKDENKALRILIQNSEDNKRSYDAMEQLLARVSKDTFARTNDAETPQSSGQSNQSQSLTSKDVELVYKQMRLKEREDANESEALQRLASVYGGETEAFLNKKAQELGLDVGTLKATARQSPKAFYNLVGENNNKVAGNVPRSSVNTSAVTDGTTSSGLRNKAYYDKLKKDMGVKSFVMDRPLQIQMHKDMMALGEQWDVA